MIRGLRVVFPFWQSLNMSMIPATGEKFKQIDRNEFWDINEMEELGGGGKTPNSSKMELEVKV